MRLPPIATALLLAAPLAAFAATPKEAGEANCRVQAPQRLQLDDPDSAKVGRVSGGEMETMEYYGTPIAVRKYVVAINAKNSYGAYTGEKLVPCFTSEDGQRVLKVGD